MEKTSNKNVSVLLSYVNFLKEYVRINNIETDPDGNFYVSCLFGNYGKCANLLLCNKSDIEFVQKYINVTIDMDKFNEYYTTSGCLPLREYNGEDTLVIGCGSPINLQVLMNRYYKAKYTLQNKWTTYGEKHQHTYHYTINPDIIMNPSVVGLFGYQKFANIPDNSFSKIIFECVCPDFCKGSYFETELVRLLKKDCVDAVYSHSFDEHDNQYSEQIFYKNDV